MPMSQNKTKLLKTRKHRQFCLLLPMQTMLRLSKLTLSALNPRRVAYLETIAFRGVAVNCQKNLLFLEAASLHDVSHQNDVIEF